MNDKNLVRGLFFLAISLIFGVQSLHYTIGTLSRAGSGLFPLIVSSFLFLIGVITVLRSRFEARVALEFNLKNIALILASLAGLALLSTYINMIVGIMFMVFCSAFTVPSYSVWRNLKISAGLIVVALAFQKLLGLSLPLY